MTNYQAVGRTFGLHIEVTAMLRSRLIVHVISVLVAGVAMSSPEAQTRESKVTFVPRATSMHGQLNLPRSTTLEAWGQANPILPGGPGSVAGITIRNERGAVVWRLVLVNVPGFDYPVAISPDHGTRLAAGRYTFDLAGSASKGIAVAASGLKTDILARSVTSSKARVRVLTSASPQPVLSAWLDEIRSPTRAEGLVLALASDAGPGSAGNENLCVSRSVTAQCMEPDHVGSEMSLSGPFLPPLPMVATAHAHLAFEYFESLAIAEEGLIFRGVALAGTSTWRGLVQMTG
jgi:hypothetical protein